MAYQKVASFSGGEKARLALALIVWQRPNLLLLDEPTNHLDIEMREALAEALVDFEGALIVVAHDRHLLATATDQWMLVADGEVAEFDGSLDDYKEWARQHRARASGQAQAAAGPTVSRRDERRAEAEARQRLSSARKPFERKLAAIEAELAPLAAEVREAEAWLATGEAYEEANRERLQDTLRRRGELQQCIAELEEDWLWNQAEMERAVDALAAPSPLGEGRGEGRS
jgi:ATP-binding cassette subfamily F protein 3